VGFLNPLFLLAGLAIAIPLLIHLLHRQRVQQIIFPALRYLKRTEKEHAARVKLRQLLVLMLRIAAILLLALAGARPFLKGAGSAHPPTALAVVLDNSASSGVVLGDERALDRLKQKAIDAVGRANDQDLIWIVRAGEPWDVVVPGSREDALLRLTNTEVSDGASNLGQAVRRAVDLVGTSELPAREVHVLSDLQVPALPDSFTLTGLGVEVLVLRPDWTPPANGAVTATQVGGGLPPIAGQPTDVASQVLETPAGGDSVAVRLWMDGEVRGAARTAGEAVVVFPVPVVGQGRLSGFVERDPDDLAADDRNYFVAEAASAPRVVVEGDPGSFVDDALEVLAASDRVERSAEGADLLVAAEGQGIRAAGAGAASWLILPPTDPVRLPGLNQRLRTAGVGWQVEEAPDGERRVAEQTVVQNLQELRINRHYRLVPDSDPAPEDVLVRLEGGEPWMVTGRAGDSRFLLLGSPIDPAWTNLPVTSVMVPLVEWWVARWSRGRSDQAALVAGESVQLPDSIRSVADPDGALLPLEGRDGQVRLTRAGLYQLFGDPDANDAEGGGLLGEIAVNVSPAESDLARSSDAVLTRAFGPDGYLVSANDWERTVFSARQGPELWRPLLMALLLVLVLESLLAATGRAEAEPVVVPG